LFDESKIPRGYWEAKRDSINLDKVVQEKLYEKGYPQDNIVFQKPSKLTVSDISSVYNLSSDDDMAEVSKLEALRQKI